MFLPQEVDVRRVLLAERIEERRVHQPLFEQGQDSAFQRVLPDAAAIVADRIPFVANSGAPVVRL
nr:hypothetical protein [Bradyrhizobium yuanmingense]